MKKKFQKRNLSISLSAILLTGTSLFAQESTKLNDVEIIGKAISSYENEGKVSLNRSGIDINNTAKSIQVFNREVIDDIHLDKIDDIIEMSSNTVYTGSTDGKSDNISMRGFSGVPILFDGIKVTNKLASPEVFNYDEIEIQKGPDSLQYGQSSPGGIVNLNRKKPIKENLAKIEFEIKDNPSFSPKIDLGGSLNKDESLYYRLVSVFEYGEGYTNSNTDTRKIFLAPSLSYDINENNKLTFLAEYTDERTPTNFGTNVNNNGELVAPIKNVTSHPDEEFNKKQKVFGFDFDGNYITWNSNFKYRYTTHERDYGNVYLPLMYNQSTNTVTRFPAEQKQNFSEHALQYTVNKEFSFFGLDNKISLGADYNKAYSESKSRVEMTPYNIVLSNPSYEQSVNPLNENNTIRDMSSAKTYVKSWGTFFQNNMNLTENLIFNTGLRYSESKPQNGQTSSATTPSLGFIYNLTPDTTLYTNYSESFTPNSSLDRNGKILDPETGKGYELGIKQKLFDDRLNLTAAVFKIEKENIALSDPNAPALSGWSVSSGKQESTGFEIDVIGDINDNLSILASYGYTNTKNKSEEDKELRNIPNHTANIFTKYKLTSFNLPYTYVGVGARYLGSKYADDANTIKLSSEVIYNATLGYKRGKWRANLSIQNLTDEEYVDGSASGNTSDTRVYVGDPRTILASISYSF